MLTGVIDFNANETSTNSKERLRQAAHVADTEVPAITVVAEPTLSDARHLHRIVDVSKLIDTTCLLYCCLDLIPYTLDLSIDTTHASITTTTNSNW